MRNVLWVLSRPIKHVLFEVCAERPDDAREAFGRLESLRRYDFYGTPVGECGCSSWLFHEPRTRVQVIAEVVPIGAVCA